MNTCPCGRPSSHRGRCKHRFQVWRDKYPERYARYAHLRARIAAENENVPHVDDDLRVRIDAARAVLMAVWAAPAHDYALEESALRVMREALRTQKARRETVGPSVAIETAQSCSSSASARAASATSMITETASKVPGA